MNLQTADDLADALAQKRAKLADLQSEEDIPTWLTTQEERNALEYQIRELGQHHAKLVDREKREREARTRANFDAAMATYHAVDLGEGEFIEAVVRAARMAREGLRERVAFEKKRFDAMTRATELARTVGQPPPPWIAGGPHRVVTEIQRRIGKDMVGEHRDPRPVFEAFHEMFDPIMPEQAEHIAWKATLDRPDPVRTVDAVADAPVRTQSLSNEPSAAFIGTNGMPIVEYDPENEHEHGGAR
ncbi:MAG TPA: hypothetical protein VM925_33440 [Labilithrix sp.]|jgi:hypothetical protein|nr:hypothetical protein [Labilithrix sp.]